MDKYRVTLKHTHVSSIVVHHIVEAHSVYDALMQGRSAHYQCRWDHFNFDMVGIWRLDTPFED